MPNANYLPCAAINFIPSTSFEEEVRRSAKSFVNGFMKLVRTRCHLSFLKSCLKDALIPMFITKWLAGVPIVEKSQNRAALDRKLRSTKMECLRCTIGEMKNKLEETARGVGYDYLTVTRRGDEEEVLRFLEMVRAAGELEVELTYKRHSKKWTQSRETPYPSRCSPYRVLYQFCFPFHLNDKYILV